MAYIGKSPVIGNFVKLDAITAVNGQAAYTMQNGGSNFTDYESVNQFLVSLNGTIQAPTDSFTVSGSTLTFVSNLSTGDVIDFIMVFGNSLSAGTPTDATVTAAKLNNDIISGQTELASEPADTDEFLVSDAGTLKRIDYSLIKATTPAFVKLATTTISSAVSAVNFDNTVVGGYNYYQVRMSNIGVSNDADDIGIKLSGDNGSSFGTIQATRAYPQSFETSSNYNVNSAGNYSYHLLAEDAEATESTDGISGAIVDIFNASNASNHKHMISHSFTKNQNGSYYAYWTTSRNQLTDAVNYIRINNENNTLDSGTFTLYGVVS